MWSTWKRTTALKMKDSAPKKGICQFSRWILYICAVLWSLGCMLQAVCVSAQRTVVRKLSPFLQSGNKLSAVHISIRWDCPFLNYSLCPTALAFGVLVSVSWRASAWGRKWTMHPAQGLAPDDLGQINIIFIAIACPLLCCS